MKDKLKLKIDYAEIIRRLIAMIASIFVFNWLFMLLWGILAQIFDFESLGYWQLFPISILLILLRDARVTLSKYQDKSDEDNTSN